MQVVQEYVLQAFNEKAGNQLLYHNYQRTAKIVELVETFSYQSATALSRHKLMLELQEAKDKAEAANTATDEEGNSASISRTVTIIE